MLWHLWIGWAIHPGPSSCPFAVEVFNVGRWLFHGDTAMVGPVDFPAIVETQVDSCQERNWLRFGHVPHRTLLMLVMLGLVWLA